MIIDTHVHFWRYAPRDYPWITDALAPLRRDFLPEHVAPLMWDAGVDACVAVQARQSDAETEALLDLADAHPFIAGVVGWVDLQADDVEVRVARAARHPSLVGIRHLVQDEADDRFLLRPAVLRGVRALAAHDLVYDILIHPRHLPVAAEFASRFPSQRFVLDHLAKPPIRARDVEPWAHDLRRLAALPNVWAKMSGLVTEADWTSWRPRDLDPYLDIAYDAFGSDRLIIGSDWPVCTLAADYGRTIGALTAWIDRQPAAARDGLLGDNALRLWRLGRRGKETS